MQSLGLQIFSCTESLGSRECLEEQPGIPALFGAVPATPRQAAAALKPWATPAGSEERAHLELKTAAALWAEGCDTTRPASEKIRVTAKKIERGDKTGSTGAQCNYRLTSHTTSSLSFSVNAEQVSGIGFPPFYYLNNESTLQMQ